PSALVTKVAVGEATMEQPTTQRKNTSSTAAQYTLPFHVGCSVMSVTHSRLRSLRWNCQSTRSPAVGMFRCGDGEVALSRPEGRAAHQHLHCLVADRSPMPERKLRVHPSGAVHTTRVSMDLANDL